MNQKFFQESGRKGGRLRAKKLTPEQRSEIASQAARARWNTSSTSWESVRFENTDLTNPAYLEEVLLVGSLSDWKKIFREIANHPFGDVAQALEKVLVSSKLYGITPLWNGILRNVQKVFP